MATSRSSKARGVNRYRVPHAELRWNCPVDRLGFKTTADVTPAKKIVGQGKAVKALAMGLEIDGPGYNIFICGAPGTGRKTTLRNALERLRGGRPLRDIVFVPGFDIPERPRLVELPAGVGRRLKREIAKLFERINKVRERVQDVGRKSALKPLLERAMERLNDSFGEFPEIARYLKLFARAVIQKDGEVFEDDYGVQLLVSRRPGQRPPAIWSTHLTFSGLFGSFERHRGDEKRPGGVPVGSIRPGALLEASGGFLIMQAHDLLEIPHAWTALKNCLNRGRVDLFDADNQSLFSSSDSRPDPVPLDVKIVLIGDYQAYDALLEGDSEFGRVFKVRVDFDIEVARTTAIAMRGYPAVISKFCRQESIRHLTSKAVAKVIEYGVRVAGRKNKISVEFSAIADLIREADFWAARHGRRLITDREIDYALHQNVERLNLLETKISEMIADGVLLIDTAGSRVGQVNGLAVYDQGDYQFGKPSRITAETSMGHGGIINIERESGLSGRSHDKGVQILGGFLRARFAQARPLSLTASVCFEQSYSGVDGDSASSTEIYAILSSLSGLPVRQDIAVTGSVNQKGDIQPIGGVNEKIEGFYDCVMARKPTGREGVIIPKRNVADLMLRPDVVAAVKAGRFSIYAVETVEQGIEILTGEPAGRRDQKGSFSEGTVFSRVDHRLEELARGIGDYPGPGQVVRSV